jgi:hypothetical protein
VWQTSHERVVGSGEGSIIVEFETDADDGADRSDVLKCDGATTDEIPLLGLMLSKRRAFLAPGLVGFFRFLGLVWWPFPIGLFTG